jgi:hypothetical protein
MKHGTRVTFERGRVLAIASQRKLKRPEFLQVVSMCSYQTLLSDIFLDPFMRMRASHADTRSISEFQLRREMTCIETQKQAIALVAGLPVRMPGRGAPFGFVPVTYDLTWPYDLHKPQPTTEAGFEASETAM